ncbi:MULTISPECIES: HAMP domain-containing sensor histidine kinase [unclassified Arcicella]|uniref:sensor histidine kinase n=1 Tax=unclassified Arcicella TaxID=2644986 RepID=UPI0028581299|nr:MULTISPECIES: HAMP domain-containing sensor histidine kinase [unclassified Arcicella]MDR6563030.1 signal transduction histidine kinase [Arcicella sp. BE51]MDR6813114.1 signal transduction histidine kinase [Arcicella sp. BE140]MDR6824428.1 signal transduction histidine kinase [Arcicella sp. BE139]
MKTQTKLAIILGLLSSTIVVVFGLSIYYFLDKYSYVDFYKRLEARVRISAQYSLNSGTLNAKYLKNLRNQHLEKLEKEKEYLIEITPNGDFEQIADKYTLPIHFLNSLSKAYTYKEKEGNLFIAGSQYKKGNKLYFVIVSAENYYALNHLIFLRSVLIAGISMVILIVVIFSFYFSKHIFDPIKEITDKVKQISTENIHLRLENNINKSIEISELTNTFNELLNRIETAFETQKNFISNASHELGTPLTTIIGEADFSLLKPRTSEEYSTALKNILQQAERLNEITKSLLFLAQTGYKGKTITFEKVRIDEIIWVSKSLIDKLNPNNKILVDLRLLPEDPKKLKVRGNQQLLHLAFANILNNACKYSNNKPVTVHIASSNSQVIIMVEDQGIGIPDAELTFIYDPFFRASNTTLFEGYGIGLPLTRNIIHLHKGNLIVSSQVNVGTKVQIKIPLMEDSYLL